MINEEETGRGQPARKMLIGQTDFSVSNWKLVDVFQVLMDNGGEMPDGVCLKFPAPPSGTLFEVRANTCENLSREVALTFHPSYT